jgi:hypothetical protein
MEPKTRQPWGRLSGLLAVCGAITVGMARDLDPDVILLRAAVAGVAVAGIVALVLHLISHIPTEE